MVPQCGCGEGSITDFAANGRKMAADAGDGADGIDMRYVGMDVYSRYWCAAETGGVGNLSYRQVTARERAAVPSRCVQ